MKQSKFKGNKYKNATRCKEIPDEIHEIISYLSHAFTSPLIGLETCDLSQYLYVNYLQDSKKYPYGQYGKGFFFIKLKWHALNMYAKYKRDFIREGTKLWDEDIVRNDENSD